MLRKLKYSRYGGFGTTGLRTRPPPSAKLRIFTALDATQGTSKLGINTLDDERQTGKIKVVKKPPRVRPTTP